MKLYIVPTPVGNLGDMTFRAVEVLKGADLILAEDTRTSRVVMQHYGITTPLQPYHIFNEHQTLYRVVELLLSGQVIALVTDAGFPIVFAIAGVLALLALVPGLRMGHAHEAAR